jgi:ubiquinone/menaquinone biosynthesis C-methylase UbiE
MTDEAQTKREAVAESFGESASVYHHSPFFRLGAQRLVELADLKPDAQLLDIGTGRGAVLFAAAEQLTEGGTVRGIDVAQEMIDLTNDELRRRGSSNATAVLMDAEALEFEDGTFDRVTCGFSLMFMPDLDRALAEMRRVLRPGGRIAVSTWGPPDELTRTYLGFMNEYREGDGTVGNLVSQPLASTDVLHAALDAGGLDEVRAIEEPVAHTFANQEEWLQQQMAITLLWLDQLTPEARSDVNARMTEVLSAALTADGIQETRTAFFAVGRKPL